MKIKDLKKGEFFTLKPLEYPKESQVYIRGEYDRTEKKYDCGKFDDNMYAYGCTEIQYKNKETGKYETL